MHGTRLADLLRASNPEVQPAISNRSRAKIMLGNYGCFLGFLDRRWLAPIRRTSCRQRDGRQRQCLHRGAERTR